MKTRKSMGLIILFKTAIFVAICKEVCMLSDTIVDNVFDESGSSCEDGWKQYGQHCFKLNIEFLTWRDASNYCNSHGGHLASIHSKEQNEFFEIFTNETGVTHWWIGLHDHEADGTFVWDDGSDVEYTNWRPGEPYEDYALNGDCVATSYIYEYYGQWYILSCNRDVHYLCQKKIGTPIIATTDIDDITETETIISSTEIGHITVPYTTVENIPVNEISYCENGWKLYGSQYCYKLYTTPTDWRSASANCKGMGGNLASIHSKEQNDFFESFSIENGVGYWWIGLYDHEVDGIFSWEDGTDVDYINWAMGEPDGDYINSGNCIAMHFLHLSGEWYVLQCTESRAYMCQKKIAAATSTPEEIDNRTVATVVFNSTEDDSIPVAAVTSTPAEIDHRTVTTSAITRLGLEARTVAAATSAPAEIDHRTVPSNITANKSNSHNSGSASVTIFIITLIIVVIFMALMGGLFYYKRTWLKEKRSKAATALFRRTERVTDPSTEFIIEEKRTI